MVMPWRVHLSVGEWIKIGRLHLMMVAQTCAHGDGLWAWHDTFEWSDNTRVGLTSVG